MKNSTIIMLVIVTIILGACCNGRKPVDSDAQIDVIATNKGKTVLIQASNGMYLCSDMNKGDSIIANRESAAAWETFSMEDLGKNQFAFSNHLGKAFCSEVGDLIIANRDQVGEWESFLVTDLGNGFSSIQNYQGKYFSVSSEKGDFVYADKTELGETEKFKIITK